MESKPIVTCHGNQVLFSSLHPTVVQGLPKEPAEWRRSYGRPPRNIFLEASFVPYDEDILPDDTDKTLISRPYFHIYWTDCDLETYRTSVKEEITDWCTAMKNKNIPDWLIVVVINEENKVKSKLLPRSSVYDKVKSDFCSKYSDRCIVLTDPLKSEGKSLESWSTFQARLRQLLLQAFSRHLQKYEDNMRALREKRNEVGWNFHEYFIVQEELAFMFEMLGLHDDALIQYDELDALFTQFVLNHASGGARKFLKSVTNTPLDNPLMSIPVSPAPPEAVQWLRSLIQPCTSWAGLSLQKSIDWDRRNQIKDNETSLLDFRNYMFTRQCALLFLLKKPAELIQRALDYLHNTVQEIKALEVEILGGGLDCWVFLSGLEVLRHCEKLTDSSQPRAQALNTANLWDYVCRKLHRLGELCGLMPGMSQHPNSEQLQLVIDLTAGMGLKAPQQNDYNDDEEQNVPTPRDKLREALSSRESFQRIYLEQCELAMGTFKHIGRFRSAKMIGKNLAYFYMKLGEPQKAENYLLDAMKMYRDEGWKYLTDMSRLDLARCQHSLADPIKYLKTACQVAVSDIVGHKDRQYYIEEVLKIAKSGTENPVLMKASPLLDPEVRNIDLENVTLDETFTIEMNIKNRSLVELTCDTIWLTITDCVPGKNKRLAGLKEPLSRQSSDALLDSRIAKNSTQVKKRIPSVIDLQPHFDISHSVVTSAGISCVNTHELLKRNDSNQSDLFQTKDKITKDTVSQCFSVDNVVLKPGDNKIEFACKTKDKITKDTVSQCFNVDNVVLKPGDNKVYFSCKGLTAGCFKAGQFGAKIYKLELLKDLPTDLSVNVVCDECHVEIIPESLLAGVYQDVTAKLHTGSSIIEAGSKIALIPSHGLQVDTDTENADVQGDTVVLEGAERGAVVEWKMRLFQEAKALSNNTLVNKVAFDCSWLPRPLLTEVTFQNPFRFSHKIHTARDMKYVQVCIHGNTGVEFEISDCMLTATNTKDVELLHLNKPGQILKVNTDQTCSCVWQLKSNIPEFPPLDLKFTMDYCCQSGQDQIKRSLPYTFSFTNYQTMLNVNVDVKPKGDNKVCLSGSLACMKLHVKSLPTMLNVNVDVKPKGDNKVCLSGSLACMKFQVKSLPVCKISQEQELMYQINTDLSVWALQGKSTGVFTVSDNGYSMEIDVMPLITGFLPLPRVQLLKYKTRGDKLLKAEEKDDSVENLESTDEESDSEDNKTSPNETLFSEGQVYYSSVGKQVHVYPENVSGDVEVTVI